MTPSTRHTLSAVLGKAKVGGLVLATLILVAGTAEAATGARLTGGSQDPVASVDDGFEPVDGGGTGVPVDDGFEPVDDQGEDGQPVDDGCEAVSAGSEDGQPVDDGYEDVPGDTCDPVDETCDAVDDPSEDGQPVDDGYEDVPGDTCDPVVDDGTDGGTDGGTDEGTGTEDACAAAVNHGQYVSEIAKSMPPGPEHGAAVSEAAHSDCGKTDQTADSTDDPADPVSDTSTKSDHVKADKAHPTKTHDQVKKTPPGQTKHDQTTSPGNSGNAHAAQHGNSASHAKGPKK